MADGGEVSFCGEPRKHESGCKYFADGGEVESVIPVDPLHSVAGHIANHGLFGMIKMNSENDLEKYHRSVNRGHKNIDSEFEKLFKNEKSSGLEDRSKYHEYIDKWISNGGIIDDIQQEAYKQNIPQQAFAHGGKVKGHPNGVSSNHPIEILYPDQSVVLQAAKGRASNYLSSLRPQKDVPKLAFDASPDQTINKKAYEKALRIADHPMSVMHHVSNGTLDPDHLKHLNAMYPEVHEAMKKKATEKIIKAQLDGKKPNAKIRQSLSLLMGTALSGELIPANIMAAQSTFQIKKQQQQGAQQPAQNKKGTSSLTKSDSSFLTGNQARERRQQRDR